MSNFCPHCGTAVSEKNAMNCFSCGKLLSGSSETTKNDSFDDSKEKLFNFAKNVKDLLIKASADLRSDETKAKLKDFANQAQSFAAEKTKDLKEEFEKINEARKATANEAKDFESSSKIENSKVIAQSFGQNYQASKRDCLLDFHYFCLFASWLFWKKVLFPTRMLRSGFRNIKRRYVILRTGQWSTNFVKPAVLWGR